MEWISSHITEIFTGLIAFFTGWYAISTYRLLSETNRPEVVVFLDFLEVYPDSKEHPYFLKLNICVQNVGLRTARKVRFDFDPDFKPAYGTPLNKIKDLNNGIDILVPGQTKPLGVSASPNAVDILNHSHYKDKGSEVKIDVKYKSTGRRKYKDNFTLDFLKWNSQPKIKNQ